MNYNLDKNFNKNFYLFVRIAIVGIIASYIQMRILILIALPYIFVSYFIMFIIVLAAGIGFFVVILMQEKGNPVKFLNKKNVNIFCIILALIIIIPAIIEFYRSNPPEEITNIIYVCNRGQELCNKIDEMKLMFDRNVARKSGDFLKNRTSILFFYWDYDKSSKEITLYQSDWKIKLRLEITGNKMTTYYISSSGNLTNKELTETDVELFNGVTWTARYKY